MGTKSPITVEKLIKKLKKKKKSGKFSRNFHCTNELKIVQFFFMSCFEFPHLHRNLQCTSFFQSRLYETLSKIYIYQSSIKY